MRSLLVLLVLLAGPLHARPYFKDLNTAEKGHISYIVTTLATTYQPILLLKMGKLERAGEKIRHVHPLRFFHHVFTNQELTQHLKTMKGSSMVWSSFWSQFKESLIKEATEGEMTTAIAQDFAKKVASEGVASPIEQRDWDAMIHLLLSKRTSASR